MCRALRFLCISSFRPSCSVYSDTLGVLSTGLSFCRFALFGVLDAQSPPRTARCERDPRVFRPLFRRSSSHALLASSAVYYSGERWAVASAAVGRIAIDSSSSPSSLLSRFSVEFRARPTIAFPNSFLNQSDGVRGNGVLATRRQWGARARFREPRLREVGEVDPVLSQRALSCVTGLILSPFRCNDGFSLQDQIVNSSGQVWHSECFVLVCTMFLLASYCPKTNVEQHYGSLRSLLLRSAAFWGKTDVLLLVRRNRAILGEWFCHRSPWCC